MIDVELGAGLVHTNETKSSKERTRKRLISSTLPPIHTDYKFKVHAESPDINVDLYSRENSTDRNICIKKGRGCSIRSNVSSSEFQRPSTESYKKIQLTTLLTTYQKPMLIFLCFQGVLIAISFMLTVALFALEGYSGSREKDFRVGLGSLLLMVQVILLVQVALLAYHVYFSRRDCRSQLDYVPESADLENHTSTSPVQSTNTVPLSSTDTTATLNECSIAGTTTDPKEQPPDYVGFESSDECDLYNDLETPYQRTVRLLNNAIQLSSNADANITHANANVARHLKTVKKLLSDPDNLHVLKSNSVRTPTGDNGTIDYLQNILQIPVVNPRVRAVKNWKKVKMNMANLNYLRLAQKTAHGDSAEADENKSSDDEVGSPKHNDDENTFEFLNGSMRRRQSLVKKRIERSEYYKDPLSVSLLDLREVLFREGSRSTPLSKKVVMLPGLQPESMERIREILANQQFLKWDFNVFDLEKYSEGHSLWFSGMMIFMHFNFSGAFNIPMEKLSNFLLYVERTYCFNPAKPNHYHTHLHAADVALTVSHFCEVGLIAQQLQGINAFSLILAAVMHDYRHPGVNNNYLVSRFDDMSIVYNDSSVLENMHASEAYRVLMDPQYNILQNWQKEDIKAFRMAFIKCILATDLAFSYDYTSKFQNAVASSKVMETPKNQMLLLQIILKVADVSHPSKPWQVHTRWSDLIEEEFFSQGDLEKEQGLPISPLCDRSLKDQPKSQCDFIEYVVHPCISMFGEFCEMTLWTDTLNSNLKKWRQSRESASVNSSNPVVSNL